MEIAPHINIDPQICSGSPVITGTRIHVSIVAGSLTGGMTMQEVMDEYGLTRAQIEGAIAYNQLEEINSAPYRQAGSLKGRITLPPDFDAPLKDFEDYM
jgi:uncharacterized protein (DUF433 family)